MNNGITEQQFCYSLVYSIPFAKRKHVSILFPTEKQSRNTKKKKNTYMDSVNSKLSSSNNNPLKNNPKFWFITSTNYLNLSSLISTLSHCLECMSFLWCTWQDPHNVLFFSFFPFPFFFQTRAKNVSIT